VVRSVGNGAGLEESSPVLDWVARRFKNNKIEALEKVASQGLGGAGFEYGRDWSTAGDVLLQN